MGKFWLRKLSKQPPEGPENMFPFGSDGKEQKMETLVSIEKHIYEKPYGKLDMRKVCFLLVFSLTC